MSPPKLMGTAAYSTTPSQYVRRALISQLVADGMIQHPAQKLVAAAAANAEPMEPPMIDIEPERRECEFSDD
jgi:hypothetical protein